MLLDGLCSSPRPLFLTATSPSPRLAAKSRRSSVGDDSMRLCGRRDDFVSRPLVPVLQVEILPQGRESPIFKQFFKDWK